MDSVFSVSSYILVLRFKKITYFCCKCFSECESACWRCLFHQHMPELFIKAYVKKIRQKASHIKKGQQISQTLTRAQQTWLEWFCFQLPTLHGLTHAALPIPLYHLNIFKHRGVKLGPESSEQGKLVRFQQGHNQGLRQLLLTVSWDLRA